ncbi:hypothetical protein RBB50_002231 [Rhinocladiella similis]
MRLSPIPAYWHTNIINSKNQTSADEVAMDVQAFPLTYPFEPADVLIADGLAFGFSLLSVVFDTLAVSFQGESFQNTFSTFVRVTRGASLDGPVQEPDDGKDPLPQRLGNTELRLAAPLNSVREQESEVIERSIHDAVQKVQHAKPYDPAQKEEISSLC